MGSGGLWVGVVHGGIRERLVSRVGPSEGMGSGWGLGLMAAALWL